MNEYVAATRGALRKEKNSVTLSSQTVDLHILADEGGRLNHKLTQNQNVRPRTNLVCIAEIRPGVDRIRVETVAEKLVAFPIIMRPADIYAQTYMHMKQAWETTNQPTKHASQTEDRNHPEKPTEAQ